ncbi:MAG: P-II family nitrogen regulator [Oscillospiraceae bacterium]|jgi:nitrogen regulatory protein PII 2|nr:P-II family nitrogen regulator [Oscillospiraceae bacterium]
MKEVMTFIRSQKVNATKRALADAGFPAFLCRPCLGRGKQAGNTSILQIALNGEDLPVSAVGQSLTEIIRLVPKRFFTLIVEDDKVELAVKTIIKVNQTGNPGDGRIFILPIAETYAVRTGENTL